MQMLFPLSDHFLSTNISTDKMIKNNITLSIVVAQEISDMLGIGQKTFHYFPSLLSSLNSAKLLTDRCSGPHCAMHHFDYPIKTIECCQKPPIVQWEHSFRIMIYFWLRLKLFGVPVKLLQCKFKKNTFQ